MNEQRNEVRRDADRDNDAALAKLLQLAGPRPAVPRDVEQRVEARVRQAWQRSQRRRVLLRWGTPLAFAASVLMAIVLVPDPVVPPPAALVGTVARVVGDVSGGVMPAAGSTVREGDTLATGDNTRISVELRDGTSLRLAANSVLRVDGSSEFTLTRGALYADTGPTVYRSHALTVHTPLALVTDVGTQFLVHYEDDGLRVAVREGRVDVAQGGAPDRVPRSAVAGEQLHVTPDQAVTLSAVAPSAALWQWAETVAPRFEIENRSLMDFLKWATRESGRQLEFASDAQRMAAMRTVLHGSIDGFSIDDAIASVMATSGFGYRLSDDRIVIE